MDSCDPQACELCGGPVVVQGSFGGTRFYIPAGEPFFQKQMELNTSDFFILDRLRRAEHIITDLRKRLGEHGRKGE